MALKEYINRIHSDLSNNFDGVSIEEKSSLNLGNYIEFSITESNKQCSVMIKKVDIESKQFNWLYKSNPLKEDSHLVERTSNVEGFLNDVKDIFEKNRFDSDYINEISK